MILEQVAPATNAPKFTFAWDGGLVQFFITLGFILVVYGLLVFAFFKVLQTQNFPAGLARK